MQQRSRCVLNNIVTLLKVIDTHAASAQTLVWKVKYTWKYSIEFIDHAPWTLVFTAMPLY